MANSKKKILFISHSSSRTGAPILLFHLAKLLQQHGEYEINVIFRTTAGSVTDDFATITRVYLAQDKSLKNRIGKRLKIIPVDEYDIAAIKNAVAGAAIIFSNTITNGRLISAIRRFTSIPVVTYVHELQMGVEMYTTPAELKQTLELTDVFAAPGNAVAEFLTTRLKVAPNKIVILPYYFPDLVNANPVTGKNKAMFVVGTAGVPDWRKGIDLFTATAVEYVRRYGKSNIMFKWRGVKKGSIAEQQLRFEVEKSGLENILTWEAPAGDMKDFYESIDLFYLPSREDPYPLVVSEAAIYGRPTVCFSGAGGITDLAADGRGIIVPFMGISEAASAIHHLRSEPETLEKIGISARNYVRMVHQNKADILQQFKKLLAFCGIR